VNNIKLSQKKNDASKVDPKTIVQGGFITYGGKHILAVMGQQLQVSLSALGKLVDP
jgi:hypothetical protein